jgi:transcription antitermination factor NusG
MTGLQSCSQIKEGQEDRALREDRAWFAAFTRSHHEKSVERHLTGRGIHCFLPLYKTMHRWSHYRKANLDLPLFPNYLFVCISRQERAHVLGVTGLLGLVGPGNRPAALSNDEIERLRAGLQERKFEPHPYLAVGERARIMAGPLAGMVGVVLRTKARLRMVLSVDLIMQSAAVEVSANELEPARAMARLN